MPYAYRGHVAVLVDQETASDGEAFAEGVRRLGLGVVIGTRTWGGEIWGSGGNALLDRGMAAVPDTGVFSADGEWLIEGHGVEPDIVVDNLPHATFAGKDAQLDAAIAYLRERIREAPVNTVTPPTYPDKRAPIVTSTASLP
jgi:tricorn protease